MSTTIKSMTVSIDSNGTLSTVCQLGEVVYDKVLVQVPTFTTAAAMRIYGSCDGTTYSYLHGSDLNSSVVGGVTMEIGSAPNGCLVQLPYWASNMKFQVTGTVCASADITVFCVVNK